MSEDKLLSMFFDIDRWTYAIEKGVGKDIDKGQLYELSKPSVRIMMLDAIKDGKFHIIPPHTAQIPKSSGGTRTVYINDPIYRIFLSICNDLLFEVAGDMVHPCCKSYMKNTSCGKVVREVTDSVVSTEGDVVGWKSDLSKYFDSVPIKYIDEAFDKVESKVGHSAIIDILRDYYHCDLYFDEYGELKSKYQSLKQGCAVAAWLADSILYHIDEKLSSLDGLYRRYSDDMLFIGKDKDIAMHILEDELGKMSMTLNPKKVENIRKDTWFDFLGFSIKGSSRSIAGTRLKNFQKAIEDRTIKSKMKYEDCLRRVVDYLYGGEYPWASAVLSVINVKKDVNEMNKFVMDCLRAVKTGKRKVGGLGHVRNGDGCVARGRGRNVRANREKTDGRIEGYLSLGCMQNALHTSRALYDTLVLQMK